MGKKGQFLEGNSHADGHGRASRMGGTGGPDTDIWGAAARWATGAEEERFWALSRLG